MPITIELPDELAAQLAEAGVPAEDAGRYALAALTEVADRAEVRAWWDSLTRREQENERAKTRQSLAAGDEGRSRPAAKGYAQTQGK